MGAGQPRVRALGPGLGGALADLVLPRTCAGCGVPGSVFCRRCAGSLGSPRVATPRRVPRGLPPTVAAGAYAGPVRAAVIAFKERGRAELAGPLGAALALAVAAGAAVVPARPVLLVPVPPSRASLRARGRDHVRELVTVAVAELGAAGVAARPAPLLARTGRVRDSTGLSVAERRANLAGTFVRRRGVAAPPGALLVLVDDVLTSGATLSEAAAALAGTGPDGHPPVLAAVVAATPRGGPGRRLPGPTWPVAGARADHSR
ncbi:putative amidophosphoribosyltransferase [Geodermatophilus bullaregiensis]|uniref:ComF family protein n=1 Tax=Geodermatophilus bullaregiensis TaxID=1564160 RepID=UPI0027DCD185|nr:ComF family protein [Geodermatophilus bullaregiensis]MBM7805772.1 putative amidophosphoribosyltransferase [Geodermatophilus bullaregiensis]